MNETTHYNLPLPHADNPLATDVGRIRAAFTELDNQLQRIDTAAALPLDAIQTTLTEMSGAIDALETATTAPTLSTFTYDSGNQRIEKITEIIAGQNKVTDYFYETNGDLKHWVVTFNSVSTKSTPIYDVNTGNIIRIETEIV